MFSISNYTINFIGYPSKYHSPEIERATMGSRLTPGRRSIDLPQRALEALWSHRKQHVEERVAKGGLRVTG
jgi:hypothetical protein